MGKHFLRDVHLITDMTAYSVKSLHVAQGEGVVHIDVYDTTQFNGARVIMRITTDDEAERLIIECGHRNEDSGYQVNRIKIVGSEYLNLSINTEIVDTKLRISFENLDDLAMDVKYYIDPSEL